MCTCKTETHYCSSTSVSRKPPGNIPIKLPWLLTWIIPTSLAPSPMASVTACVWWRTKSTSSAFCSGDVRQQRTALHDAATLRKSHRHSYVNAKFNVCDNANMWWIGLVVNTLVSFSKVALHQSGYYLDRWLSADRLAIAECKKPPSELSLSSL